MHPFTTLIVCSYKMIGNSLKSKFDTVVGKWQCSEEEDTRSGEMC